MDANGWIVAGVAGTAYGLFLVIRTVLRDRTTHRDQFTATRYYGPYAPLVLLFASTVLAFIRYYPTLKASRPDDPLVLLSTLSYAMSYYFLAGLISVIMPAARSDGVIRNKTWTVALATLWLLAFFASVRVAA